MKTKILVLITFALPFFFACNQTSSGEHKHQHDEAAHAHAADEHATAFTVEGNCSMCKTRIEEAALEVEGVTHASWDQQTKQLSFEGSALKHDVQKAVAVAGHDNDMHKASDDDYQNLAGCCLYRD